MEVQHVTRSAVKEDINGAQFASNAFITARSVDSISA
jgi:hypothetical protein